MLRLSGDRAAAGDIKTFDPLAGAQWERGNTARLSVPAGASRTFFLEGPPVGELTMTVERVDEAGVILDQVTRTFGLGELVHAPRGVLLGPSGWRDLSSDEHPSDLVGTGFRMSWHGDAPGEIVPSEVDPELREQLLALGYIDG